MGQWDAYFRHDGSEGNQVRDALVQATRLCKSCGQKQRTFQVTALPSCLRAVEQPVCPNCGAENDLLVKDDLRELLLQLSADLGEDIDVACKDIPVCPRTWQIEYRDRRSGGYDVVDISSWIGPLDTLLKTRLDSAGKFRPFEWVLRDVATPNGTRQIEAGLLNLYSEDELGKLAEQWEQQGFQDFGELVAARTQARSSLRIVRSKRQKLTAFALIALAVAILAILGVNFLN